MLMPNIDKSSIQSHEKYLEVTSNGDRLQPILKSKTRATALHYGMIGVGVIALIFLGYIYAKKYGDEDDR